MTGSPAARSRRRWARLLPVLALAPVLTLPALRSSPARADGAVELRMELGPGGAGVPGGWSTLTLNVRNRGGDLHGHAVVRTSRTESGGAPSVVCSNGSCTSSSPNQDDRISYRLPVSLASGADRRVRVSLADAGGALIHADIIDDDGGSIVASAEQQQLGANTLGGPQVLVVSDASGALDELSRIRLPAYRAEGTGTMSPQCGGCAPNRQNELELVQVLHLAVDGLPSSAVGLSGLAAVVLDQAGSAALTEAQRGAIADYVRAGGVLVTTGGEAARSTAAGVTGALLPVRLTGTGTASLSSVAAMLGAGPPDAPVPIATLDVLGGSVLYADGNVPLVVAARVGSGHAVYLAFDPAAEPLARWPGEGELLRRVLGRLQASGPLSYGTNQFRAVPGGGIAQRGAILERAVTALGAISLPPGGLIGGLLVLYIALVGPANYLVLRRLRRLDLAWITVPAISLVAAAGAYVTGLGMDRHTAVASSVRVFTIEPGSDRSYVESFNAVYLPGGGTHVLQRAGDPYFTDLSGLGGFDTSVLIDREASNSVVVTGAAASIHGFSTAEFRPAPGRFAASLSQQGSHIAGSITSNLGVELTNATIVGAGAQTVLGSLRPGESTPVNLALPGVGESASGLQSGIGNVTCYEFGACGGQPSGVGRAELARQQLIAALATGPLAGGGPTLVAVARNRLLPPDLSGASLTADGVDVVVVPLDPYLAAQAQSWPGHPVVGGEGLGRQALLPGRPSEYEFWLPGAHWRNLVVSSTAFVYGASGAQAIPYPNRLGTPNGLSLPPPGTSDVASVAVEALNLTTGSWDPVGALHSGSRGSLSIADPASHVGSDGTLRLRFTSSAQQSSLETPTVTGEAADGGAAG